MTERDQVIVAITFFIFYVAANFIVASQVFLSLDSTVFRAINSFSSDQSLVPAEVFLTQFGSEVILGLLGVLVYLAGREQRRLAFAIFAGIVVSDLVLLILKSWYVRPRPYKVLSGVVLPLGQDMGSSFPSGHVTRSFAISSILATRWKRRYSLIFLLSVGVAMSRVLLGVHFPFDALAGSFLGIGIGISVSLLIERLINMRSGPGSMPSR